MLEPLASSHAVLADDERDLGPAAGGFLVDRVTIRFISDAAAQVAAMLVQRCIHLLAPATSDLPLQLTRHGPAHSGFATTQKTLTALGKFYKFTLDTKWKDLPKKTQDAILYGSGDETRTWRPPEHDGVSTYYLSINRNKQSIVLDFSDPDDVALTHELFRRAAGARS